MWCADKTGTPQRHFVPLTEMVQGVCSDRSVHGGSNWLQTSSEDRTGEAFAEHPLCLLCAKCPIKCGHSWSHSVLQSPLEVGIISTHQERKRGWGRWMNRTAGQGAGWDTCRRMRLKLLFIQNAFESMNKRILEHNKRRNRLYKDSMGPVSIPNLGN